MRRLVATEYDESVAFWQWLTLKWPQFQRMIFHVPNERSNKVQAARLQAVGVSSGVSDYICLIPRGRWHGMVVEHKRGADDNSVSVSQAAFLAGANAFGYFTYVSVGVDSICSVFDWYLRLPPFAGPDNESEEVIAPYCADGTPEKMNQ